jgi:hypothetical protein
MAPGHAREQTSKERTERDSHARTTQAHIGPILMAPGLAFDGSRAPLAARSGLLQRKVRMAEPGDPR